MPDPRYQHRGDLLVQVYIESAQAADVRNTNASLRELAEMENTHVSPERKSFFSKLKEYFQAGNR